MAVEARGKWAQGFALLSFLLLLLGFYAYVEGWLQQAHNPNQAPMQSDGMLRLLPSQDGHYRVSGQINGYPVVFVLDTGATGIALSEQLAQRIGLVGMGEVRSMTANGLVLAKRTQLQSIQIGEIRLINMPASILPNMDDEVLLGMSFLRHFDWRRAQGELWLTPMQNNF